MRWEASLQRQFKQFLLEANYIGNKTNHIEVTRNINALPRAVSEHAADARRRLQQPADRQHSRTRCYNLVPGNSQGIYTGTTTSPADAAFAVPGLRLQRHQHHREHRLLAGTTASSSPPPSASPRATPSRAATRFQKWMQAVNLLNAVRPRARPRNLRRRRAAPHQHLAASGRCPSAKAARFAAQHQRFRFPPGRRLGSLRHLEHPERIRAALGQRDLLRRPGQHPAAARPADSGALVQRRQLRDRHRQAVARQPGPHLAVPLPARCADRARTTSTSR